MNPFIASHVTPMKAEFKWHLRGRDGQGGFEP